MIDVLRTAALLAVLMPLAAAATDEWPDFIPPADAGTIDVKSYGAVGDGKADDTAAIRKAIWANIDRNRYAAPPFIYLPAGTYRLTGPIEGRVEDVHGWSSGWRAGFLLVGQGRGKTVLKLDDRCAGYGDAGAPRWVVATGSEADGPNEGGGGNRAFRHCVANLTIDVGTGNPGAIALDFIASNRGTVENVRLVAGADSGFKALAMDRNWPGPALIKRLETRGFATAISMDHHWEYSMTFEDIAIRDPRTVGILTRANPVFMRKLDYQGKAPAFQGLDGNGMLTLIDSTVKGSGPVAIHTEGAAYIRNLTSTGFATIIEAADGVKAKDPVKAQKIERWQQAPGLQTADGSAKPAWLDLPIEETPLYAPKGAGDWINGGKDLQAAIDSGKPVVYLPNGAYTYDKPIIVRGKVRKIIGLQSCLKATGGGELLRIEDTEQPVVFEHLWFDGTVHHTGRNAAVFRHVDFVEHEYLADGPGKTFLEDVIGRWRIGKGHSLWARQTNAEFGDVPLLVNDGGTAWILGFKTEGQMTCFKAMGGATEILGALFYPLSDVHGGTPAVELSGGARFAAAWRFSGRCYPVQVRRDGKDYAPTDWKRSWIWSTQIAK